MVEQTKTPELETRILKILQQNPEGIEDQLLTVALKDVDEIQKVQALNSLIQNSRIMLYQSGRGVPVYKFQTEDQAKKLRELEQEDVLVYYAIEESGNRGIWINEIKQKIPQLNNTVTLNKILKKLDNKGLIKSVKTIQKNRKVWMLMEIEPSVEITGGLIGQENFDLEVIEVIQERIVEHLKKQGSATLRELLIFVKKIGLTPTESYYSDDDIEQIIKVLVYDMKIEDQSGQGLNKIYKACNWEYPYKVVYTQVPCAHCPVKRECGPNNLINPKVSPYLAQWTNQNL